MLYPLAEVDWNAPAFATFFRNLPKEVQTKVTAHRERHEEAERLSALRSHVRAEQGTELGQLKATIAINERAKANFEKIGGWTPEAQFDLDELHAAKDRLEAKLVVKPQQTTDKSKINREREFQSAFTPYLEDWLRTINPTTARFKFAPASTKGWNIDKIRGAIDDLIRERRGVVLLPPQRESAKAAAFAAVDKMAARGAPDLSDVFRNAGTVDWPADTFFVKDLSASLQTQYGVSFQCWLNPDAVKARFVAEIEAKIPAHGGISDKERKDKLAAIDAKWLELQRIEEAVADAMDAVDKPVARRILHPLAMLQIEQIESAPAKPVMYPDTTQDFPTQGAKNWADAADMPIKGGIGYVPRTTTPAAEE